jgi:hypothetical protein
MKTFSEMLKEKLPGGNIRTFADNIKVILREGDWVQQEQ